MKNFAKIVVVLAALPIWVGSVHPAPAAETRRACRFESGRWRDSGQAQGLLRVPEGAGPSPTVVLLRRRWRELDEWGKVLAEWGYVTLTIDRFGTRGITHTCTSGLPLSNMHDAYRALEFLVGLSSVDPNRVAMAGFSQGGMLALLSVERGQIERSAREKFRAAIAFYPPCLGIKGNMTVPTLILVGELDDWAPANECRNLAEGRDDWGILARERIGYSDRDRRLPRRPS